MKKALKYFRVSAMMLVMSILLLSHQVLAAGCGQDPTSEYVRANRDRVTEASIADDAPMPGSALENAIAFGYDDLVEALAADKNIMRRDGQKALNTAALLGRVGAIDRLVLAGASPNWVAEGNVPIEGAVQNGCIEALERLVELGANINRNYGVRTGLIRFAVVGEEYETAKWLARHGYRASAQEKRFVRLMLIRRGKEAMYREIFGNSP